MSDPFIPSPRLRAQHQFDVNFAELKVRIHAKHPDWLIKTSEQGVLKDRRGAVHEGITAVASFSDHVHIARSNHYDWRAADLSLFVPAEPNTPVPPTHENGMKGVSAVFYRQVVDSDDPIWAEVHAMWLEIDPLNRVMPSSSADAGHFSRALDAMDTRI